MKKFLLSLISFFFLFNLLSFSQVTYKASRHSDGITVSYSLSDFSLQQLNYKGEALSEISMSEMTIPNEAGMPNLPCVSRFIAVPCGAEAVLNVTHCSKTIMNGVNVAPALKIQAENEEPEFDYIKNEEVYTDAFYPAEPFGLVDKTSLRGIDAVMLSICPFQYNPVTEELIIYDSIEINIDFVGGTHHFGTDKYRSVWFDPILRNAFLNYEALPEINVNANVASYAKDASGCEYLIVIPNNEAWLPYAEQIKNYRSRQGIITKVMSLEEMGVTTTDELKAFFHAAYNNWDIPPVAVLLMADHNNDMSQGIPAEVIYHPYNGSCITDNQYADVNGDLLPEMVFARMVAEDEGQLNTMVSKLLEYEFTNPCMDEGFYNHPITALGWQTERWFQICAETVGGYLRSQGKEPTRINEIYDGNPGQIWSSAQNTNAVVNYFGPDGQNYIPNSPSELGGWNGGTPDKIVEAVNNGAFILQHRDHGYEQGWGEPSFSSAYLQQLENYGKLTFVFTINCLTGKFNLSPSCFLEKFYRLTKNNQNTGAVGLIGPTEVSYSFVNDAYVWGVYDLFDSDFLPAYGPYAQNSGNWMPAFGNVSGKYFLAQTGWAKEKSDSKDITYQMFTAHCDAFLRLFTEVPQELAVEHPDKVTTGVVPLTITCTEGAMIAVSIDNEILAVAEATGELQNIYLPEIGAGNIISVVCTKQNYLRHESSFMSVPSEGAFLIGAGWIIKDENNNGYPAYDERLYVDFSIENIGVETVHNISLAGEDNDDFYTLLNQNIVIDSITAGEVVTVENAFIIDCHNNIPDNYYVEIPVLMSSNGYSWTASFNFTAYAPVIELGNYGVSGDFIQGNTVNVGVIIKNNGGANAYNVTGLFQAESEYITINSDYPVFYGDIEAYNNAPAYFSVTVAADAPFNVAIPCSVTVSADYDVDTILNFNLYVDDCNVAISDFPYTEDFEHDGNIPDCWSQEILNGNSGWIFEKGGVSMHPHDAHSGVRNALFYSSLSGSVARLITPPFNLDNSNPSVLSFWHVQEMRSDKYQDELRVYCKNSAAADWILLAEYTDSISEWTLDEIELPNTSAYCQLAFEAKSNASYGIVIDDICINANFLSCMPVENLSADVANSAVTLLWSKPSEQDEAIESYNIYRNNVLYDNVSELTFSEPIYFPTVYEYGVSAVYENACESELSVQIVSFCDKPDQLSGEYVNGNVNLTWETTGNPDYFNVYRDSLLLMSELVANSFIDVAPPQGDFVYKVNAVSYDCGASDFAKVNVAVAGTESFVSKITLSPNPADKSVTISGEQIYSIIIFDNLSKIQIEKTIDAVDKTVVNTATLKSGIYYVCVALTSGEIYFSKLIINHK
ncbi:MAG: C25 family cysteine peptidase [Bacteroidales bacterium]|nr:C25 family cysteine peptidase [Bacteroidales bacterium]